MNDEILERCRERFATHKATLIQDTDRYLAIDWRRSDGSVDYYVNYILDKNRGSLIISGDLGDCIATWYNKVSAKNMKSYIGSSIDYFISKFQCASDDFTYDEDDIVADIRKTITEREYDISYYCERNCVSESEFWEEIKHEVYESVRGGKFVPTERLLEIIGWIDGDYFEWIGDCGKRISPRVYFWAVGFQMACDQLGI